MPRRGSSYVEYIELGRSDNTPAAVPCLKKMYISLVFRLAEFEESVDLANQ